MDTVGSIKVVLIENFLGSEKKQHRNGQQEEKRRRLLEVLLCKYPIAQ